MFRKISALLPLVLTGLFTAVSYASAFSPVHVTEIDVQRGEKWWGIFLSNAPVQPFLEPFEVNTASSSASGLYSPIMLSSNGRYIWSGNPLDIKFDGQTITVGSAFEKVEVQRGGKNLREAYLVCRHKNFPPNGDIPDISMFTLPLYDTSLDVGFSQGQEEILGYAAKIIEKGLPAGIIVIPDGWASVNNPYAFDRELYPDPAQMMAGLHEMGFKAMLTVTPYAPAYGRSYVSGREEGLFLCDGEGTPAVMATEGGLGVCYNLARGGGMIDRALKKLREDYSVDGFRFDCREALPLLNSEERDGFMEEWLKLGKGVAVCEYIPGGKGQTPSYVSGLLNDDAVRPGTSYARLLVAALNDIISAGLAGSPYSRPASSPDDPGVLLADQKQMAKYLQFEAVMPVMKISFAPWRITDAALYEAVKDAISLREGMADYIRELVGESARTAEPLVRHMEYQFPKSGFADCNDQFMLGPRYLFAPCTADTGKRTVRLPKGVWNDRNGRRYKGPVVTEVDCSDGKVVYFVLVANK